MPSATCTAQQLLWERVFLYPPCSWAAAIAAALPWIAPSFWHFPAPVMLGRGFNCAVSEPVSKASFFLHHAVIYMLPVDSSTGAVKVRAGFHAWEMQLRMLLWCHVPAQANTSGSVLTS